MGHKTPDKQTKQTNHNTFDTDCGLFIYYICLLMLILVPQCWLNANNKYLLTVKSCPETKENHHCNIGCKSLRVNAMGKMRKFWICIYFDAELMNFLSVVYGDTDVEFIIHFEYLSM